MWVTCGTAGGGCDVFDGGFVGPDLACRGAPDNWRLDLFPPPASSGLEPVRLRPCGSLDQFLRFDLLSLPQRPPGAGAQQRRGLFPDLPDCLWVPVESSAANTSSSSCAAFWVSVSPARRRSIRWAQALSMVLPRQALSMVLPRRPLTCWDRFWRASVMAWLEREIRLTATAVRGSHIRSALRKAAEGMIATTCTASRQVNGRPHSQSPTPLCSLQRRPGPGRCPGSQSLSSRARIVSRSLIQGPGSRARTGTGAHRCPASSD
jgi:hypothetical protein